MNYNAPKPASVAVTLQSCAVIVFAFCLYLFWNAHQTSKDYDVAIQQLKERKLQLNRISRHVDNYMNFIHSNPSYQASASEPQWEKIAETWENLPFPTLMQRFENLYGEERPFVLDYFSVTYKADNQQTGAAEDNSSETKGEKLKFNVQGYYLCPRP